MSQQSTKTKTESASEDSVTFRPWGISFSIAAFAIIGAYYLVYPLLRDVNLYPLYALGALSLIASYGFLKMRRWSAWLGAALFPAQIIAPTFAFLDVVEGPGLLSDFTVLAFAASLVVLIFVSTLSFLFILDRRKSFK
jgi:hypothetical protein